MIRFMRCFIWVLGAAVVAPATCPAANPCGASGVISPLPSGLKVGQRWTYLMISEQLDLNSDAILDRRIYTWTISVVSRRKINNKTYFELRYGESGGGLYRVDGWRKTWCYDAEKGTETLHWDIWRPPFHSDSAEFIFYSSESEDLEMVVRGEPIFPELLHVERIGPLELQDMTQEGISHFFPSYPDSSKYGAPDRDTWLENLMAWEATPVYDFSMWVYESAHHLVIAPNVGVLYYHVGTWEFASTRILLSYEPEDSEQTGTSIEDVSFGEIKEQMRLLQKRQP